VYKDLSFEAVYAVDADLDPEGRSMTYTETANITNTGSDSTKELYFHIYGNMYKDLYKVEDGDITVTSILDDVGNELSYRRTQKGVLYRVKLAQPLESGETVELTFACQVLIPDLAQKYGVSPDGDLQLPSFAVQLAIYDKNGWDTDSLSEEGDGRYAAVADYYLTVRVPEAYTLACNGSELSYETRDGIATYSFFAEKRRDLIIIACENYVPLERTVGNTTVLGYFNETVSCVTPENMEKVMDYTAFALEYFSEIFVEYPYDTLIVTNAAIGSNFAVNMEYPGLITVYFDTGGATSGSRTAAFHEVAHQWFYSLIGNDENQEPWLDEGFATFATGLCLEEAGIGNVEEIYWDVYATSDTTMAGQVINVAADKADNYSFVIYNRGCMFLKHLMDAVGKEEFLSIVSDYCCEHIYGIVTTEDFLTALYAGTDVDVAAIVDEYIG
jgi:hypothetical protein